MKKFLLSTVIGTTLMSTITGGSLAFAEDKQNVQVSYVAMPEIATSEYMVSIPANIEFTSVKDAVDLEIKLFNNDGEVYNSGNGVNISIASENEFNLKSDDEALSYSLTYGSSVFNNANKSSQIKLTQSNPSITGKAKINVAKSIKPGHYSDILTYTVTVAG